MRDFDDDIQGAYPKLDGLNPDLVASVSFLDFTGMWFIDNRIMRMPICGPDEVPTEDLIAYLNRIYESKLLKLDEAKNSLNWLRYLLLIESPYRIDELLEIRDLIASHSEYWDLVGHLWTMAHQTHNDLDGFIELFEDPRPGREEMMTVDDRNCLDTFPDAITIWRGSKVRESDWAWSINKEVAIWFAHFGSGPSFLIEGSCFKRDVMAYFNGREEEEILIYPDKVQVVNIENASVYEPVKKPGKEQGETIEEC